MTCPRSAAAGRLHRRPHAPREERTGRPADVQAPSGREVLPHAEREAYCEGRSYGSSTTTKSPVVPSGRGVVSLPFPGVRAIVEPWMFRFFTQLAVNPKLSPAAADPSAVPLMV